MNLAQRVCQLCLEVFLDHWPFFIVLLVLSVFTSQWYESYFRINRETYNVDLMKRYMYLEMRRRYAPNKNI